MKPKKSLRFLELENGCMCCVSHACGTHGYVVINCGWGVETLHTLVYRLRFGDIPKGYHVHHICHNKRCVNPQHLELIEGREHVSRHSRNQPLGPRNPTAHSRAVRLGSEGWTPKEIAEAINAPVGTVRRWLREWRTQCTALTSGRLSRP